MRRNLWRSAAYLALPAAALIAIARPSCAVAEGSVVLTAPAEVAAGADFEVGWSGGKDAKDFVTLVQQDKAEGSYDQYQYAKSTPLTLTAPDEPGVYEIRYLGKDSPYPTLGRQTLTVTPVTATLQGPNTADAGAKIEFTWTGPDHKRDFITVVEADAPERKYGTYVYTRRGNPNTLVVPEQPGNYELRYLTGQKYYTLARHAFTVVAVSATVEGPAEVTEGSTFAVRINGTGNTLDFVTIVPADAPEQKYGDYAYARSETLELTAPETPGPYEVRYLTARGYRTLASYPLQVSAAGATLNGPDEVRGGEAFSVQWTGPDNQHDYLTIVETDAGPREYGDFAYTRHGSPLSLLAPLQPGDYELRYALGVSRKILARAQIRVTEPRTRPGSLRVVRSALEGTVALPEGAAVELILDASGSMLQQQDGQRRIDLAKKVLTELVSDSLPAGTPFALRVFGHREADSCRTDLEINLSPLDPSTAASRISAIEAKNLAKTPIARSLELVAEDLAGKSSASVVVLVTDGEETCGGDPAAALRSLRERGFDVRVNIVGFAIGDEELKATFRSWADLGGGSYQDATSAQDLSDSIQSSLRAAYEVLDAQGARVARGVVGDRALELPAGDYRLRVEGAKEDFAVTVSPDDTIVVDLSQRGG